MECLQEFPEHHKMILDRLNEQREQDRFTDITLIVDGGWGGGRRRSRGRGLASLSHPRRPRRVRAAPGARRCPLAGTGPRRRVGGQSLFPQARGFNLLKFSRGALERRIAGWGWEDVSTGLVNSLLRISRLGACLPGVTWEGGFPPTPSRVLKRSWRGAETPLLHWYPLWEPPE